LLELVKFERYCATGSGNNGGLRVSWLNLVALGLALAAPQVQVPAPILAAHVAGRVVKYSGVPELRITVPAGATYLGADRFVLKELSDCEMHIFVEANVNRRVRRFYWVQFESYLPSKPEDRMTYGDIDRRANLWGATAWIRTEPAQSSRTPRPGSDTEHFRNIIRRAGYAMPHGMMTVRLVRLLDDPKGTGYGRRELMMIYGEDMAPTGLTYEGVTTSGEPNGRWAALEKPLLKRAIKAFHVNER